MINRSNYDKIINEFGLENLDPVLKTQHENYLSIQEFYDDDDEIKQTIDLYFSKLEKFINKFQQKRPENIVNKESSNESASKTKSKRNTKKGSDKKLSLKKESKAAPKQTNIKVKKVEHLREEVKFIRRFVSLHNKTKSPSSILSFIKSLQRSIVQRLIRKNSPLAKDIEVIQDKLIKAYNRMKGDEAFVINDKDLGRLVAIAGGEQVYPSISVIKRFIGLQEKTDERKTDAFIKFTENLIKNKKITKDDPYADKVNSIYKIAKQQKAIKIPITKAELNGLQGIVEDCGCKDHIGTIYDTAGKRLRPCKSKSYSDASRGACSHHQGLNGILTAEEMANRKLDLLSFFSFWLALFGMPARNFTMMFHGEPHNGKTIFLLKLAQYLAENFGDVLYVSSEEFASPTMTTKVKEFLTPFPKRLHFAENLKDPDLSQYQFVILDSVNDLGLKINEYKEIRKANPETAFIFILQHTKAGDFKGGKDWEHIAEIAGEVHKGVVTITKNRYAPKNTLNFFKQFGIQWQEPLNPTDGDDMITPKNGHY